MEVQKGWQARRNHIDNQNRTGHSTEINKTGTFIEINRNVGGWFPSTEKVAPMGRTYFIVIRIRDSKASRTKPRIL
jgi:hypothetical protein